MPASVLYMSMSLDGYIAGPNDKPGNPGGDGFGRLHEWYGDSQPSGAGPSKASEEFLDEMNAAGAVLAGPRTVEQVDHWSGDVHGVPIFVPSHRPPPPSVANYPLVRYVADGIESAMAQAKAQPGTGTCRCLVRTRRSGRWRPGCWTSCRSTRSRCCWARGSGCSTSCRCPSSWTIVRVIDTPAATHIRYRVRR